MAASSLPKVHVSFSGCGFLGVYHVGSMAAFQDHQKRSLEKEQKKEPPLPGEPPRFVIDHCLGASAGALVAAALLINYPATQLKAKFMEIAANVKSLTFGPFSPKFNANVIFREELEKVLPEDAHIQVQNRLHISLTDTSMQNVIDSQFASRKDLMDALICSCFLPAFSAYDTPTYKGKPFLDGGFSNNQPVFDDRTTVRVSPFAGTSHICPDDGTPEDKRLIFQKFNLSGMFAQRIVGTRTPETRFAGEKMELSFSNMKRIMEAVMPCENLEQLYTKGYQHTDDFIRSGKIKQFFFYDPPLPPPPPTSSPPPPSTKEDHPKDPKTPPTSTS